jgi:hypothetical protein
VGKTESSSRLHGSEDARVELGLSSIGDEANNHVRLGNNVENFTKSTILLVKVDSTGFFARRGVGAETNDYFGVHAGLSESVAEILGLSRSLRTPSNDTNLLDALESFREKGVFVTSTSAVGAKKLLLLIN